MNTEYKHICISHIVIGYGMIGCGDDEVWDMIMCG